MKQFLYKLLFFSFPFICLFGFYEFLLFELNETKSVAAAYEAQKVDSSLFMRKYLSQSFKAYKTNGINQSNPEILIVGSSRVMQINGDFFRGNFYNAGGLIQNNSDLVDFLKTEIKADLILIGVDPWWYKDDYNKYSTSDNKSEFQTLFKLRYNSISQLNDIWMDYLEPRNSNHIGTNAQISNGGFRFDGSRKISDQRIKMLLSEKKFIDTEDPPISERIKTASTLTFTLSPLDTASYIASIAMIRQLIDKGKKVIVYLPPFTNESYKLFSEVDMQGDFFNFTNTFMPSVLDRFDISYIRTEIPSQYGLDDTYFMDGFHPSEVFLAHQLKRHSDKFFNKIDTLIIENNIKNRFCNILLKGSEFKIIKN